MSIPTHNLYDFIMQCTKNKYWLRYFFPYGSKDLVQAVDYYSRNCQEDIQIAKQTYNHFLHTRKIFKDKEHVFNFVQFQPVLFCHDQEPLKFNLYQDHLINPELLKTWRTDNHFELNNLNIRHSDPYNYLKKWIILHSEINSTELQKYENTEKFVGAYWWSHAVLARDWYRFAEYDNRLKNKNFQKTFLIYSRESSGSRSYRKQFVDSLVQSPLSHHCQIGSFDSYYYDGYSWSGQWDWHRYYQKNDIVIHNDILYVCSDNHKSEDFSKDQFYWSKFEKQDAPSDASATYNVNDFTQTNISVVLETVFDQRIHLTEKTLRPIACGHPFIIANGPGVLKYLKKYGFKTFSPWINEEYDNIQDSQQRLNAILDEMKRIANLSKESKNTLVQECNQIAEYNKSLFFSRSFLDQVKKELVDNVENAYQKTNGELDVNTLWDIYNQQKKSKIFKEKYNFNLKRPYIVTLIKHLKKGGTLENYVPPDLD